jgi:biopolymer transport protein TolR
VIDLPTVGKAADVPTAPLEIQIAENGDLSWRKREADASFQPVQQDEIAQTILNVVEPDQPVVIAAHGKVPYEAVVAIMDRLRANGVQRLGLLVEQKQGQQAVDVTPTGQ